MSNLTQLVAANGPTVAPGTVTSSQYYTPTGWSAGEYVYQTPTGEIAPRTTGGLGYNGLYNGGNVILTGSSFVPSPLQSVQYSPLYDYGTYTGATRAAGTQVGSTTTLVAATALYSIYSFGLINGNVATVYVRQSDLQVVLDIRTPDGAAVVSPISIPTATASSSQPYPEISGCCTTAGNIIVTWYQSNGNQVKFAVYSQAGTLIQGATSTNAQNNPRYHQTIALAGGGWLLAGNSGNSSQTYVLIATASNTFINTNPQGFPASQVTGYSTVACQLTDGNIALAALDPPNSNARFGIMRLDGSMVFNGSPMVSIANSNSIRMSIVALPGARFAASYGNTSNQPQLSTFSYGTSSFTQLSSIIFPGIPGGLGARAVVNLSPTLGVKIYCLCANSSGSLNIVQADYISGTATTPTLTTLVSSFNSVNQNRMGTIVNTLNGRATISWQTNASDVASASFAISTLTNGTILYGGNYTLKDNYTLLGVAATTVAAGGTGPVITNGGSVTLNANYPLVTPVVQFSYQGVGTAFGQRGTVNNRVAVLKGLEL